MFKFYIKYFLIFFILSSCVPRASYEISVESNRTNASVKSIEPKSFNQRKENSERNKSSNTLKIVSWNIQDLGRTKNDSVIAVIVNVLKDFDIVAIQEVVAKHPAGAQKVALIADELNRKGAKWDYRISDPTKSPSVYISERYAFLWKTNKVNILGKAYLDNEIASKVFREPYIAKFKQKNKKAICTIVNFHSRKFNDNPELEIKYFNTYSKRLNTDKLIIAGDFNLNESHPVWNELYKQGFQSALENSKSSLKRNCSTGNYLSHNIDNIYYSKEINLVNSGVVDYVGSCKKLSAARTISDHLPVFMEFRFLENEYQ